MKYCAPAHPESMSPSSSMGVNECAYRQPCSSTSCVSRSTSHASSSHTQPGGSQTADSETCRRCIRSSENGSDSSGVKPLRPVVRAWFSHTTSRTTADSSPEKPCIAPNSRIESGSPVWLTTQ